MIRPPLNQRQLQKEAFLPLLIGIGVLLGLGGAGFGLSKLISGYQENIVADSNQLRDILAGLPSKYPNNPQYTQSLVQDSQNLAVSCQDLLTMVNAGSKDPSAVNEFHTKLVAADMLIKKIRSEFEVLAQLEAIDFAPRINGHIQAVESGLNALSSALASAGQQQAAGGEMKRQEDGSEMEMVHSPDGTTPPLAMPTAKPPLTDAQKQEVADFLNANYEPGTTLRNLPERLTDISQRITSQLGIDNVTPQRLMTADLTAMRGVFWNWQNPEAAAKYKQPNWSNSKA